MNGYRPRSDKEFSEYQKKIEAIDNVILCVAEAEKMCHEVGKALISESEIDEELAEHKTKERNSSHSKCAQYYL